MTNNYITVYCSLQVEGIHCWTDCTIDEVKYLSLTHRHIFHIKAYTKVEHSNRDVEFIKLKHEILDFLAVKYYNNDIRLHDFGNKSCEMIATEILDNFNLVQVEVSEDNENGAIVTKTP